MQTVNKTCSVRAEKLGLAIGLSLGSAVLLYGLWILWLALVPPAWAPPGSEWVAHSFLVVAAIGMAAVLVGLVLYTIGGIAWLLLSAVRSAARFLRRARRLMAEEDERLSVATARAQMRRAAAVPESEVLEIQRIEETGQILLTEEESFARNAEIERRADEARAYFARKRRQQQHKPDPPPPNRDTP